MDHQPKRTPLYERHVTAGAKLVEFGGFEMPVQYSGIIREHEAVRNAAGLFDVSHMGEILCYGPQALGFLQYLLTNDFSKRRINRATYSPMCDESGGTLDDLLVYRLAQEHYLLVVNAGNADADWEHIKQAGQAFPQAHLQNLSRDFGQIALQGPKAMTIAQRAVGDSADLLALRNYEFVQEVPVAGVLCLISRTGYTGEDGVELYMDAEQTGQVWDALLQLGEPEGLVLCGLGARDTLRFEASMPLYGHELSRDITPLEAGLEMFVKLDKSEDYIGKQALRDVAEQGIGRRRIGLRMIERGIAREGYPVLDADGQQIGFVTSGNMSPTLGANLAMAMIPAGLVETGAELTVEIRGKAVKAEVVPLPFYRRVK